MISPRHPLLLASGSPRRREILTQLRIPMVAKSVSVDESAQKGESPEKYLARIVEQKLLAGRKHASAEYAGLLVADTVVIRGADDATGQILGKPTSEHETKRMIRELGGTQHWVKTRFAVEGAHQVRQETVTTAVTFRVLTEAEIDGYVATGEGADKAGGYAIQGIGAFMVSAIDGCYTNVVGLPASAVIAALTEIGLLEDYPVGF